MDEGGTTFVEQVISFWVVFWYFIFVCNIVYKLGKLVYKRVMREE
jgi:hypothetical protein